MTPHQFQVEPDLNALLTTGKEIDPVSDIVRARALSRARASIEATAAVPVPAGTTWHKRVLSLAAAAALVLAVGVVGAVVAIRTLVPPRPAPVPPAGPSVLIDPPSAAPQPQALPIAPPPSTTTTKNLRPIRHVAASDSYAAELELLQRAQAAYAGQDFAHALSVVAEHRRRFPTGRLVEEREALRVRALVGAGRTVEARAAAASFAERFPRSVLLPRLSPESR